MFVLAPSSIERILTPRDGRQNCFFFFQKQIQNTVIAYGAPSAFEMASFLTNKWHFSYWWQRFIRALEFAGECKWKICILLIYLHLRWLRPKRTLRYVCVCVCFPFSFHVLSLRFKRYHYDHFHRYSKVGSRASIHFVCFGKRCTKFICIKLLITFMFVRRKRKKARADNEIECECRSKCDIVRCVSVCVCLSCDVMGRAHKCFLANLPSPILFLLLPSRLVCTINKTTDRPTDRLNARMQLR